MSAREHLLDFLESLPADEIDARLEEIADPAILSDIAEGLAEREQSRVVELAEAGDVGIAVRESLAIVEEQLGRSLTGKEAQGVSRYVDQQIAAGQHPDVPGAFARWASDTGAEPPSRRERMADAIERANPVELPERPEKPGEGSTAEERRAYRRDFMAWSHATGWEGDNEDNEEEEVAA